jgi:3-oxoadipate enol-lactonase
MSKERFIEANGNKLHVLIDGAADRPWLTLLHGLAAHAGLWENQVRAFSPYFRCLRLSMRGHGKSSVERPPSSFEDIVADVVAMWDAVGVETSNVVGISMGGMTGFGLALGHPQRLIKLVAADCRADAPQFFYDMWTKRQALLRDKGMDAVAEETLPIWLSEATRKNRPDLVALARKMIAGTSTEGWMGASRALQRLDYKRRLSEIRCPTLLISGALDMWHPQEMREMAGLIPGAEFVEIAEAAHIASLEQPEQFNDAVLSFLRR